MKSSWIILFSMLGHTKFICYVKLLRWVFSFLLITLRECDTKGFDKFIYYKIVVVAMFRLYLLLIDEENTY